MFKIDEKTIKVVYPGYDDIFSKATKSEVLKIKKKYKLNKYLLFVGSLKPIKNIPVIIEVFSGYLKYKKGDCVLVLVGSDYWLDKRIDECIKKFQVNDRVIRLGYVPRDDLAAIYSGADVFLSPSLYEGFGFPLLESMACGTPVITSSIGSMPEVVKDAGVLVNPRNPNEIIKSLVGLEKSEKYKRELIMKGLKRAKKFSWSNFCNEVLDEIF